MDRAAAEPVSTPLKVWYIDGSPFARIVRATLIEFDVAHEAIELAS